MEQWPTFADEEILCRHRAGPLPESWRLVVAGGSLRPVYWKGGELAVVRGIGRAGELACVASGRRMVWRRMLAVDGPKGLSPWRDSAVRGWMVVGNHRSRRVSRASRANGEHLT